MPWDMHGVRRNHHARPERRRRRHPRGTRPFARLVVYDRDSLCFVGIIYKCYPRQPAVLPIKAPDFSAAEKGFDARGTELSGRMVALNYHLQDSQCKGDVSRYPKGNRSYEVCLPKRSDLRI